MNYMNYVSQLSAVRSMRRLILAVLLLSISSPVLLFSTSANGQELSGIPAAFVDVGYGARPAAMGGAFVGLSDDAFSVQWNPAGMSRQDSTKVSFAYIDQLGLVNYQHVATSVPLGEAYGLGAAVVASGDEAMRELTFQLGVSRSFRSLSFGVGLKYRNASFGNNTLDPDDYAVFEPWEIQNGIANQVSGQANGFGLDLGVLYQPDLPVRVGLRVRDIIAPMRWESEVSNPDRETLGSYTERIPMEIGLGTAYFVREDVVITADYSPGVEDGVNDRVRVGGEAQFLGVLSLRGGLEQRINDRDDEKYSLGLGVEVPIGSELFISADYTYRFEEINRTQHVSLSVSF